MTVRPFRVALSAGFRKADGSMTYPSFDLSPLTDASGIETRFLSHEDPIRAQELEDIDALILLSERFTKNSMAVGSVWTYVTVWTKEAVWRRTTV